MVLGFKRFLIVGVIAALAGFVLAVAAQSGGAASVPTTSVPTVTTPTGTTTVPTGPPSIKAQLAIHWRFTARTRLTHLAITQMPPQSFVSFQCAGKDCPKIQGAGAKNLARFESRVDGHTFAPGDVVEIDISKQGFKTERARFRILDNRAPQTSLTND